MKRNLLQALLGLALFGVVIQVILVAPRVVKDHSSDAPQPAATGPSGDGGVDQSLQGMHTIETSKDGKEWELWSDKADRVKAKEVVLLKTVKTVFFARSGVTFTVTGDEGTVESKTKNIKIIGNTVTRSSNGYTFRSDRLDYDSETKTLSTASPIEMRGPPDKKGQGLHLNGRGMRALMEEGTMEILSDVRAEKNFESGKRVFIRSRRALFSSNDHSAKFLGDVILDMDTMRITGPTAQFDYDSKSDEVSGITINGGVKVSDTDKWATSDNLKIDFDADKFTFWGRPRVVQNNDELKGEEIVFLEGGRQVQVNRARAKMDEKRMGKN